MTHNTKSTTNIVALVVLSLAEGAAVVLSHFGHAWWGLGLVTVVAAGLGMWYLTHRDKGREWGLSLAVIATKLLSNTIMPTRTGVLYLLAFILHISWLPDTILNIAQAGSDACGNTALMLVEFIGIIILTLYCPNGKTEKNDKPGKVFISGLSAITERQLELATEDITKSNLYPLIRSLQLTEADDTECDMLILLSDDFTKNETKASELISQMTSLISNRQDDTTQEMSLRDKIETLIKCMALRVFPEKTWISDGLHITLTPPCNYNDFEQCYNTMSSRVRAMDDKNHNIIFNLSPGTGIVSALITLLAIDGDRTLYYYSQDATLPPETRLTKVNKNDIPLQSLLSQALESIS